MIRKITKSLNHYKFAHLADCHIGRWKDEPHKSNEINAFKQAIKKCIEENVDLILISGDLFDSNIPNLDVVDVVFKTLKEVVENGINIYIVFGSHDHSYNRQSVSKLLCSAGIVKDVGIDFSDEAKQIVTIDEVSDLQILGVAGLSGGAEESVYDELDLEELHVDLGPKFFMFHSAITECLPVELEMIESVDLSRLPAGFDYYAGGHLHENIVSGDEDHATVVYPGPLYGTNYTDFEKMAKGVKRGFYIGTVAEDELTLEFNEIKVADFVLKEVNFKEKTPSEIREELNDFDVDVSGKIVMVKLVGTLIGGSESDIRVIDFTKKMRERGAIDVKTNIRGINVIREEIKRRELEGLTNEEIEEKTLELQTKKFEKEHLELQAERIKGKEGEKTARLMLGCMRRGKRYKEGKREYESKIIEEATRILEVNR